MTLNMPSSLFEESKSYSLLFSDSGTRIAFQKASGDSPVSASISIYKINISCKSTRITGLQHLALFGSCRI